MTIDQLHSDLLLLEEKDILNYILINKNGLKILFIKNEINALNTSYLSQILNRLSSIKMSTASLESEEIQFLYISLALYFKRSNSYSFVVNTSQIIIDPAIKNRLSAWIHYQLYSSINSHVDNFSQYVDKIQSSIYSLDEDYENDILHDLNDYYNWGIKEILQTSNSSLLEQFQNKFLEEELIKKYPILKYYQENKHQFTTEITISKINDKIFQPSVFTEKLFNDMFLHYIKHNAKTEWARLPLGYDAETIRSKIINFGQTNFDKGYKDLSSSDVVKLYSYFNMRKHYYSSLSLFERFDMFEHVYNAHGIIKFIDIGCGPATSAIALIDYLSTFRRPVSFDYFGIDSYESMRLEAEKFMNNEMYSSILHQEYLSNLKDFNFDWLKNANSIFINTCYLFASPDLDEIELAESIINIKKAKNIVPFYIFFQNTTNPSKNIKYFNFKKQFTTFEEYLSENSTIYYNNKRDTFDSSGNETVYFEILKLT